LVFRTPEERRRAITEKDFRKELKPRIGSAGPASAST
jgi:hypothetical protein